MNPSSKCCEIIQLPDKVLVIVAHPDDEILGCGGFMSKHSNVSQFRILFMAEGSSCRFDKNDHESIRDAIKHRERCALTALALFGISDIHFLNLECGKLDQVPILEMNKVIEKHLSDFNPKTILTHSAHDANSDHRRVAESVIMSTRPGALNFVKNVFSFEIPSSSEWAFEKAFEPNYFVELSDVDIETKIRGLMTYDSEVKDFPFPRSEIGLRTFARYRGMQSGVSFAEGFRLIRSIGN